MLLKNQGSAMRPLSDLCCWMLLVFVGRYVSLKNHYSLKNQGFQGLNMRKERL